MPITNIYYTAYVTIQKTVTTGHSSDNNVLSPVMCNVCSEVSDFVVKTLGILVSQ